MGVPGFPSWDNLLTTLKKHIRQTKGQRANKVCETFDALRVDPLECAEYFCRVSDKKGGGLNKIRKELTKIIRTADKKTNSSHLTPQRLLVNHFNCIYTTNYDRLLEKANSRNKKKCTIYNTPICKKVRQDWLLGRSRSNCNANAEQVKATQIIKYHGDYLGPQSIVITESDYYRRLIDLDAKDIMLMRDLLFYDILFLGYGFGDISVKYVFHQIRRLLDEVDIDKRLSNYPKGRLFFVTTDNRKDRMEFLEKAYNVHAMCIQRLSGEVVVRSSSCKTVVYDPRKRCVKSSDSMIQLVNYRQVHAVAEIESSGLEEEDKITEICDSWEEFGAKPPRPECLMRQLVKERLFTKLRSSVIRECYGIFLKKLVETS
jgi:hypothetical protein